MMNLCGDFLKNIHLFSTKSIDIKSILWYYELRYRNKLYEGGGLVGKIQISIPEDAKKIITLLNNAGFEAYIVGGCVRDSLLNLEPKDWDITTSAKPEDVHKIFNGHKIIDTGLKHGTVTIVMNDEPYEVTTFRKDGQYSDSRHPDQVYFTSNLVDDLSRRDFTINSICYHHKKGLIDPFNGRADLENMVIKCVGCPDERFREDSLRILRALRFSAQLGFSIDKATQEALVYGRHRLNTISAERISSELKKMLVAKNFLSVFANIKVLPVIFEIIPELRQTLDFEQHNKYHTKDVYGHIIQATNYSNPTFVQRMALLLHDVAKPQCFSLDVNNVGHFYEHEEQSSILANKILLRLKVDTKTRETIVLLIKHHDANFTPTQKFVNKMLNKLGEENFRELIAIKKADVLAQSHQFLTERLNDILEIENMVTQTMNSEHCFTLKDLNINGVDIMSLGITQGEIVGDTLKYLLSNVIDEKMENDKGVLKTEAKRYIEQIRVG